MKKQIELSLEKAREMYGKDAAMDELLLANFSKEELTKPVLPTTFLWEGEITGHIIRHSADIIGVGTHSAFFGDNLNIFVSRKHARRALLEARLGHLVKLYNDGWEPDWNNNAQRKSTIIRCRDAIRVDFKYNVYDFLAFKSNEVRDVFLNNFRKEIEEYFML